MSGGIIIVLSLFMFITVLIVHRILLRRTDLQDILRKVAERCAQCITSLKSCIKKENDITPDDAYFILCSLIGFLL